jgi:hypothetical protein
MTCLGEEKFQFLWPSLVGGGSEGGSYEPGTVEENPKIYIIISSADSGGWLLVLALCAQVTASYFLGVAGNLGSFHSSEPLIVYYKNNALESERIVRSTLSAHHFNKLTSSSVNRSRFLSSQHFFLSGCISDSAANTNLLYHRTLR